MSTTTRILVLIGVLGGFTYVGYRLQRNDPSESRRIHHPQGYSVCCPKGWSVEKNDADAGERFANAKRLDGLMLMPDTFTSVPPKLFINRFETYPDEKALRADGWIDGLFQNQPAMVREKKLHHGLLRTALIERDGKCFEMVETTSVTGSLEKEEWWRFLETFRYPDGPLPTTAPARIVSVPTTAPSEPFQFPAN